MFDRESRKRASKRQAKLKSDRRIASMLNDKLETLVPSIINAIIPNLNPNANSNGSKVWRIPSLISTALTTCLYVMPRVFFKRGHSLGGMVKNMLEGRKLL